MLFFGQDFIPAMEKVKEAGFDHYEMWNLEDHPLGIGAKNKDIDFSWIDKMEKTKVSQREILDFIEKGKLTTPKGGAQ